MKKSLKIVFFILVFSCMVCSCWLTFPFARIPVHKHDGNVVAFANKTSTERIKLIAKHTTSSVLNEKYGGVRTFYMHWDCDIECRANCTTPVKTMLIEILNSWDSILIIRDDTVRLEYIGCKMSNMGDSAHSIYNIDSWKSDYYVCDDDTFDILRFTFVEDDFNAPDTVAVPYEVILNQRYPDD